MRHIFALAAALAVSGCGGEGGTYAQIVAEGFDRDCREPAPNAKLANDLDKICDCTKARIAASDIALSDSEDVQNDKIHAAADACSREYYGDGQPDANSG